MSALRTFITNNFRKVLKRNKKKKSIFFFFFRKKFFFFFWRILRARLINCNGNYIRTIIDITRNTKCCNVMLITIHLGNDNIIIEPYRK